MARAFSAVRGINAAPGMRDPGMIYNELPLDLRMLIGYPAADVCNPCHSERWQCALNVAGVAAITAGAFTDRFTMTTTW
jgi:hypothetical protein